MSFFRHKQCMGPLRLGDFIQSQLFVAQKGTFDWNFHHNIPVVNWICMDHYEFIWPIFPISVIGTM